LDVFDALSDWGVFELAIGGGEPTLHPDIHKILAYANARGIVPNITTRNKKWLTDPNNLAWIVECVGGVGFSVDTVEDVVALDNELEKSRLYKMEVLSDLHDTFVLTLWDLFDEWCVEHNLHKKAFWNNAPSIKSQINIHVVLGAHPKDQTLAVIKKAR